MRVQAVFIACVLTSACAPLPGGGTEESIVGSWSLFCDDGTHDDALVEQDGTVILESWEDWNTYDGSGSVTSDEDQVTFFADAYFNQNGIAISAGIEGTGTLLDDSTAVFDLDIITISSGNNDRRILECEAEACSGWNDDGCE